MRTNLYSGVSYVKEERQQREHVAGNRREQVSAAVAVEVRYM